MLYIILADSAFELVPKHKKNQPAVRKNIKKLGNAGKILDISLHHTIMRDMDDPYSRGRPDIMHKFLLDALSSPLNRMNHLRIYVHTRRDVTYEINPLLRPPKDYNRFKGVLYKLWKEKSIKIKDTDKIDKDTLLNEKLIEESRADKITKNQYREALRLRENSVKNPGKPESGPPLQFLKLSHFREYENTVLIRSVKKRIRDFVEYLNPDRIIRFTSRGKLLTPNTVFSNIKPDQHVLSIVGGFQSGSFSTEISNIKAGEVAIFPMGIEAWAIFNRIIINYEDVIWRSIQNKRGNLK